MNENLESIQYLKKFIDELYDYPGVYQMFDENNKILYIGKAKNLKKRLSDYLNFFSLTRRIQEVIVKLKRIEIIITKSEEEALILEAQLIRSLKPIYNILLKIEKPYNFILLNDNIIDYPSFEIINTKNPSNINVKKNNIFGPFYSNFQITKILDLIYQNFKIRNCNDQYFKTHLKKSKTCLQFDIGRCSGPCAKKITKEEYSENLKNATKFLQGDTRSLIKILEKNMIYFAENLNFENAILLRDRIKAIKNFKNKQFIDISFDGDYMSFIYSENLLTIMKLRIFGGNNYGSKAYFIEKISSNNEIKSIINDFLIQLFLEIEPLNHIYHNLDDGIIDIDNIKNILYSIENRNKFIEFINPLRGQKRKIIDDLILNAKEISKIKLNKFKDNSLIIEDIKKWLEIDPSKNIDRIEVFDNSHIMGTFAVASVIVFSVKDGFLKKDYRSYNIKTTDLPDDYQMIREIFFRRFPKYNLPDLIIIDGGIGHLRVAKSMIGKIYGKDFIDFNMISIAKGEKRNDGLETIFLKNENQIKTTHEDPKIHFLQRLRDEAHRFAIKKHRERRNKIF
jgi:excinuclease ABC subunit C